MKSDFIDAPLHFPHNLAGCAICILVVYEEKRKVRVPEVTLESVADGQLQKLIDTFKEQAFQIFSVVIVISMVLHKKCHIPEQLSVIHVFIQHQFICTHSLSPLLKTFF